jgi:hypothetical protein
MNDSTESINKNPWLVLTHQVPPTPDYLRVKVRRRLDQVGAIALKPSVYVLPASDDGLEDFEWIRREIEQEGGEATICEATFVDGVTDARLEGRFRSLRETEYESIAGSARELVAAALGGETDARGLAAVHRRAGTLRRRLASVAGPEQFGASGRQAAERAMADLEAAMESKGRSSSRSGVNRPAGAMWVTRQGVKVDRLASAWLIRRFIDATAEFRFVPAQGYEALAGEERFDMFEGGYTHEGDACTFEVLVARFDPGDAALVPIAEIVHDIDCKDEKFGRPEVAGVASLIDGIVRRHPSDEARLDRGLELLDDLYGHFRNLPA